MTLLLQAQTRLADEKARFEAEETRFKADIAAANRLYVMASSLFQSFSQQRHDHLKPFEAAVADALRKAAR